MYAYCNNNPVTRSDKNGNSSHYCCNPSCFKCRRKRRTYVNEHLDWYNKVTGSNIECVDYKGDLVYKTTYVPDYNSLEFKVLRTVGICLKSFELNLDCGVGFGVNWNFLSVIDVGIETTATQHWEASGHSGVDSGPKSTPFAISGTIFGMGDTFELSSFESSAQGKSIPETGIDDSVTLFSIGGYAFVGASAEIGFNYKYFQEQVGRLW